MRKVISDCPVPATLASPASVPSLSAAEQKTREGLTYVVPKGNFVLAAPGVSQVDEKIWGKDAGEFNPSRWLDGGAGTNEQEEDEGEEDYGWGKISKGGKSACKSSRSFVSDDADLRFQTFRSVLVDTDVSESSLPTSSSVRLSPR